MVACFLTAHGLVHAALAVAPRPDVPDAPTGTSGRHSWLLPNLRIGEAGVKLAGIVLWIVATAGFAAAGLALFGIVLPSGWWRVLATASGVVSLLLLVLFWHRYLVIGVLIDIGILAALLLAHWPPVDVVGA